MSARLRAVLVVVVFVVGLIAFTGAPAWSAPAKPAAKKVKDYVGKADQRRDDEGRYSFESGAYQIGTDVDKTLANDVAAHMDAVYKEFDFRLSKFRPNPYAAVKPNQKMPLYVMRRYEDYLGLLAGFGISGENSGGMFFRTAEGKSGLATWVEGQSRLKMYYILQHEGFHQFADARIMSGLPPWVNEGLAEYFGDSIMVNGQLLIGRLDRDRIERMRKAVRAKETIPFSKLMTMSNDAWRQRVMTGEGAALMYDTAWSACYFLIHGGKRGEPLRVPEGPALEYYLRLLNNEFIRNPRVDPSPAAFQKVFSNNLTEFERQWKSNLEKLQPDPWFSSVRHLQFVAAALTLFHREKVEFKDWPQLKETMERSGFRTVIRERDAAANPDQEQMQAKTDAVDYDFPAPAEVEVVPSANEDLPAGLRITNVTPNIVLSWSKGADNKAEQIITFEDPPKKPPVKKVPTTKPTAKPKPTRK